MCTVCAHEHEGQRSVFGVFFNSFSTLLFFCCCFETSLSFNLELTDPV